METITVGGKDLSVEFIGSGTFATVYRSCDDPETAYAVVNGCPMKQAIAGINHPHVPPITPLGQSDGSDVFSMPFYQKLSSDENTGIYYNIREARNIAIDRIRSSSKNFGFKYHGLEVSRETVKCLREQKNVPDSVVDALSLIVERMAPIGADAMLDIHRDNFAEDKDGNIILLDVAWKYE